ncbi:MAG: hypothetical protein ACREB9_02890 [Thermoplasmata archaeon]
MSPQRIWRDPTRPRLTELPEAVRRQVLKRIARAAVRWVRGRPARSDGGGSDDELHR